MKPVELCLSIKCDQDNTKGQDIVLGHLFGGSGTTMIACREAKRQRHSRLMELDPKYCDVIVQRWQGFTGKQAKLEGSGETFPIIKENAA